MRTVLLLAAWGVLAFAVLAFLVAVVDAIGARK